MRRFALITTVIPTMVQAEGWVALDGEGIRAALSDKACAYAAAAQRFYASGRTVYSAGEDSWGVAR